MIIEPHLLPLVSDSLLVGTTDNPLPSNLNLPPDCAPYVLVLTEVPCLRDNAVESYNALLNKVRWWLDTFIRGPFRPAKNVIMVRRVPWVGYGPKRSKRDCVIINFDNNTFSNSVLATFYAQHEAMDGIIPLPLCYFYQKPIPLLSNLNFSSHPLRPCPFITQNKFYPLTDMNDND